ncbi:hypothetical protein D3C73_1427790 [compost metagenome]
MEELRRIQGVKEVLQDGSSLTVISQKGSYNLQQIIACAMEPGEREITSLSMVQPSLEQVFLTLTGRSLRNGKGGGAG